MTEPVKAYHMNFDDETMKRRVADNLHLKKNAIKEILLPAVQKTFVLENVVYQVVYVRDNPLGFSARPIGILQPEEAKK